MSFEDEAKKRGCYCSSWDDETNPPENLIKRGIPKGYCGKCESCGADGHARHFPGPVPYTGAWCDQCYAELAKSYESSPELFTPTNESLKELRESEEEH